MLRGSPHLSVMRLLAFSTDPVLRREVVRRQPPPTPKLLAVATASAGEPAGLLMGENLQLWDSEAGAVMLCWPSLFRSLEEEVWYVSSMASSSGTVRILGRGMLGSDPKPFSGGLHNSNQTIRSGPVQCSFVICLDYCSL